MERSQVHSNQLGCNFTNALFRYIYLKESDGEATAATISVGLGVIIHALIKLVVLFIDEMKVAAPKDKSHGNFCLRMK